MLRRVAYLWVGGEPVFDRLDADIAHALMSINAVKGVEIGAGFASVAQKGTEHRDEITPAGFLSNHAGGVLGGISSGQSITAALALKPTSSLRLRGAQHQCAGRANRGDYHRPSRPLCRYSCHADCRSHAGAGIDRPCATTSWAECRCAH